MDPNQANEGASVARARLCFGLAVAFCCAGVQCADSGESSEAPHDGQLARYVPPSMRWEPHWREDGDCGPIAAYVFMRLLGHDITLQRVKHVVPIELPKGTSLESLRAGCESLGCPAEVWFVPPADLCRLDGPLVVHVNGSLQSATGHFYVIGAFDSVRQEFLIINPAFEQAQWIPEDALLREMSGYVLVPTAWPSIPWTTTVAIALFAAGVAIPIKLRQARSRTT